MNYIKQNDMVIQLDGTEEYFTKCTECGTEIRFVDDEYYELVQQHGVEGWWMKCEKCSDGKLVAFPGGGEK